MEFPQLNGMVNNESDPCTSLSEQLFTTAEVLRDTHPLAESFHNMRHGILPRRKPEEVMTYQGLAEHQKERDLEMARRYHRFSSERRRLWSLQQKAAMEQAAQERQRRVAEQETIERQRRQVEQAFILERSRQKAILAQQQRQRLLFAPINQHGPYASIAPQSKCLSPLNPASNTSYQELVFSEGVLGAHQASVRASPTLPVATGRLSQQVLQRQAVDGQNVNAHTEDGRAQQITASQRMSLDESITSSPTYRSSPAARLVPEAAVTEVRGSQVSRYPQSHKATTPSRTTSDNQVRHTAQRASSTASSAREMLLQLAQTMAQPPRDILAQQRPRRLQSCITSSAAYSLAATSTEDNVVDDQTEVASPKTPLHAAKVPTHPTNADDEDTAMLDKHGFPSDEAQGASPTLSGIIGSETPSEEEDDEDDGDWDFDPKGPSPPPPGHRAVKAFGMRTRRASSTRARR